MRSTLVYVEDIMDISDFENIAAELLQKLKAKNFLLDKNSLGILFCDIDLATDQFASLIANGLNFPVIGASALANLTNGGYQKDSVSLLVLTADDASFVPAISEKFSRETFRQQIEDTYKQALSKLGDEEPKAIFLLSPLVSDKHMHTDFAETLSEVSGGLPVFGGVASDYMDFANFQIIYEGKTYNDRLVIMLMSGNVRPVSTANDKPSAVGKFARVTETDGTILKKVDDMNFVEYCHSLGITKNLPFVLTFYVIRSKYYDEQGRAYYINRTVQELLEEEGWARTSAAFPVGTEISLCTVSRNDITESCASGFTKLLEKMKANEADAYKYSTIFAFTCVLRHMIMAHESFKEGEITSAMRPEDINLSGFYTLGEFGPVEFEDAQGADSRFLNCALVFCAV